MSPRGGQALFTLLFLNFLLYGGVTTVVGATLPSILRDFGWSYLAAGAVFAASTTGYFVTTFCAGIAVSRIGPRRLITLGLFLQALGVGCFGVSSWISANMLALVLLGIGQGTTEIVTNYTVVQMEPEGQSRKMNLMHAAFTLGAIATPFAIGLLLDMEDRWQLIYRVMAGLSLLMMVVLHVSALRFTPPRGGETLSLSALSALLRHPLLGLLTVIIFLYVGVEIGISSWISEWFVTRHHASASTGAYMVSTFWLGIFLGRLLTSALYHGRRQLRLLAGFSILATLGLLLAITSGQSLVAALLFFVTGLGFSAIYPIVIAIVGDAFPTRPGMAIGVVTTGGGLGACLFPFLMSALADRFGLQTGFWFYLALTALMALVALGISFPSLRAPGDRDH